MSVLLNGINSAARWSKSKPSNTLRFIHSLESLCRETGDWPRVEKSGGTNVNAGRCSWVVTFGLLILESSKQKSPPDLRRIVGRLRTNKTVLGERIAEVVFRKPRFTCTQVFWRSHSRPPTLLNTIVANVWQQGKLTSLLCLCDPWITAPTCGQRGN